MHRDSERLWPRDLHANSAKRGGGGHENALQIVVTPVEVGRVLGDPDRPEKRPRTVEDLNSTRCGAVKIACSIELHSIGCALALAGDLGPDAGVGELSIRRHIEVPDVAALRVIYKKSLLVMGEAESVRLTEIVRKELDLMSIRSVGTDPVHPSEVELGVALEPEPFHTAVGGIGEDEGPVLRLDDVVRGIEFLSVPVDGEDGGRAIELGADHPARVVLATYETSLRVIDISIRLVAWLPESGDPNAGSPLPHVVPGHVAEDQMLLVGVPDGPLGEDETDGELLHLDIRVNDLEKAWITDIVRHYFLPFSAQICSTFLSPTYHSRGGISS